MADMFTPGRIGKLELKNRLIRSATWEALADGEGKVTDGLIAHAVARVRGEVGLFILGITAMAPEGKAMRGMTGIYSDEQIPGHSRLCAAAHEAGGRVSVQLAHVGAQATVEDLGGVQPVGPSAVFHPSFSVTPRALSTDEVKKLVEGFGQAAARAVKAGYDAIEIHGAHGYLVDQFMSPRFNHRQDEYGDPQNFALEVYQAVRANAGQAAVLIKLNLDDLIEGSVTPEIALPVAKALSAAGIDAIEVSAGMPAAREKGPARPHIKSPEEEAYFLDLAKRVKATVKCPVISVGGWRSPAVINLAIKSGDVDFVAMARPFLREPALVKRWKDGDLATAYCISCSRCFGTLGLGEGIQCYQVHKEKRKKK